MATKRKVVRKSSKKRTSSKKTTRKTSKKPASKKTKKVVRKPSKKKVVKKSSSKKKTPAKKRPVKKKAPAKKKASTKKKSTPKKTKKSSAKKPSPKKKAPTRKGPVLNLEKDRINLLLKEINLLEKDNHKLTEQISKASTKQEVVQELKSYLALLKQSPEPRNRNLPTLGETQQEYNPAIEQKEKELAQQVEKANNKDKLISRLKSLLATSRKDPDPEYMPPETEIEIAAGVPTSQKELPPQEAEDEDVHIEIEASQKPQVQPVEEQVSEEEVLEEPQEEQSDEEANEEEEEKPKVDVEELVKQRLEQIEQNEEAMKGEFQSATKRGVLTTENAQEYSDILKKMVEEINKVFIGQSEAVEGVLISVICDAHSLLEGVPGLAKTLLIETLGKIIDGTTFKRIQFLPDLLPSDIIGGQVFNPKTAEYKIYKGPIFANFVLCDEINRAPPKTHAAVMEAMQEKKINIENEEFKLDRPFFVLATQNPLENKGTYDLPEAVLDRFMFKVMLDYPLRKHEIQIITENATTKNLKKNLRPVIDKKKLLEIQAKVKKAYISDKIREYILDIVEATRGVNKNIEGYKFVKYGAGVRASIYLSLAAKARAVIEGRNYVLPDDVAYVAYNTLRHRVVMNYRGKAHNISPEKIIDEILTKVKAL